MRVEPLPSKPDIERHDKQARDLAKIFRTADTETMYLIRQRHPRLPERPNTNDRNPVTDEQIRRTGVTLADARAIIAGCHQFETWPDFTRHIRELNRKGSPVAQFEAAADAIVNGDVTKLKRLLRDNPDLIRMRSTREHRATLLHYVGSNAVEQYRQKTPKNIVKIAKILLEAGAEIDADLDYRQSGIYSDRRGSTTLGLAGTSCHPEAAGVQIELIDLLIDYGASVNGLAGGWNPVIACLHNGRGGAAAHLAKRGARMDLEGAAGVGKFDVVKTFFTADGSLKGGATKAQMEYGFMWACEYGHDRVADFLLQKGVDVAAMPHDETGLHWASYGGHARVVKTLLRWNPPLDVIDKRFDGTPLGWALYGWFEKARGANHKGYYEVVARLVRAGATVKEEWLSVRQMPKKIRADRKMRASLHGELLR